MTAASRLWPGIEEYSIKKEVLLHGQEQIDSAQAAAGGAAGRSGHGRPLPAADRRAGASGCRLKGYHPPAAGGGRNPGVVEIQR